LSYIFSNKNTKILYGRELEMVYDIKNWFLSKPGDILLIKEPFKIIKISCDMVTLEAYRCAAEDFPHLSIILKKNNVYLFESIKVGNEDLIVGKDVLPNSAKVIDLGGGSYSYVVDKYEIKNSVRRADKNSG